MRAGRHRRRPATRLAWAAGLLVLATVLPAGAEDLLVVDGNRIVVDGQTVRLLGIEAPEADRMCGSGTARRPCGEDAKRALTRLVEGARVRCEGLEGPRFGHEIVATCWAGEVDLGRALVRRGWARADRQYSSRYVHDEDEARASGRGFWSRAATSPWR